VATIQIIALRQFNFAICNRVPLASRGSNLEATARLETRNETLRESSKT